MIRWRTHFMKKSFKMRFMCVFSATLILLGSISLPVSVRADDDDDFLEDLVDLTPDEQIALEIIIDMDHDGDIDEDDVEAIAAGFEAAAIAEEERERERAREEERRREEAAEAEAQRQRQAQIELERQRQATADAQRQAAADQLRALELEKQLREEKEKAKKKEGRVTGIALSSTDVVLTPGQTYQVIAYVLPDQARNKRVYFSSTNASVATVDGSGIIRANSIGSCVIKATTDEGSYSACTTVRVNPAPAQAALTVSQDANWTAIATNMIIAAAPGATVNLIAPKAMSFDAGMINALKVRSDVSVLVGYPYNGHTYALAVPAGYNLAAKMDQSGKVSFVKLAAVKDGKILTSMVN